MKDEQIKRELGLLEEYKKMAKENNDIKQWHQLCTVIRHWKEYSKEIRDNILDCVAKHATCRYKEN